MSYTSLAALLTPQGDSDLIAKVKRRDPDAMGELYDRFGKMAFELIAHIVKDRALAEDLLAETFVKAWNRVPGLDMNGISLGLWVFCMARNQSLEYLRSRSGRIGRAASIPEALEQSQLFENLRPGDHTLDRVAEIRQAFTELDENERQMLHLAYFEGLTENEIAAKLEQPQETIEAWVHRAIDKLRTRTDITNS